MPVCEVQSGINMGKRKHVTLSIEQKAAILDKLKRNVSGKQLAREYGVGTSTISDIKKNSCKIERYNIFMFILFFTEVVFFKVFLRNVTEGRDHEKL